MGYTLVSSASLLVLLPFAHFLCLFYQYCSSSFGFSFFLPSLSPCKGTKESIAAGHTGGMEAVLLFRPWCLLCEIRKGRRVV